MERVPWDEPCIVSPNHQNAFLDALLIGAHAPTKMSYLSRSDIFGTRFDWVLKALQMVPVYRRRDGYEKLALNERIFNMQRENLRQGKSLLIFSEAEHGLTYYLRPLSKGSARFAAKSQAVMADQTVWLVPVGINYYHHQRPGFKVSIVFGQPVPVSDYVESLACGDADEASEDASEDASTDPRRINDLRSDLADAMKSCLLVPELTPRYDEQVSHINRHTERLPFDELRAALSEDAQLPEKEPDRVGLDRLGHVVDVLNAPVVLLTSRIMRWVNDPVFALSLKFATGILVLPLWWTVLFLAGWSFSGWLTGIVLVAVAAVTLLIRRSLIRWSNPPHVLEHEESA